MLKQNKTKQNATTATKTPPLFKKFLYFKLHCHRSQKILISKLETYKKQKSPPQRCDT